MPSSTRYRMDKRILAGLCSAVCIGPFLYLIGLSLVTEWPYPAIFPTSFEIDLWIRMIKGSGSLGISFGLSLVISLIVAMCSTFAGFMTGKYIAYHRHKSALLFLAYVPYIMSPVILGTCLMYLYIKGNLTGSISGVILAHTMFAYGFSIVFLVHFGIRVFERWKNLCTHWAAAYCMPTRKCFFQYRKMLF